MVHSVNVLMVVERLSVGFDVIYMRGLVIVVPHCTSKGGCCVDLLVLEDGDVVFPILAT